MNTYEAKKQARIERLEARIERLKKFAEGKDLSMFGESRSGIPLGQPILVGHHSERRHRRHLERIERVVRAGYDALKKVENLENRLESIKSNRAIMTDDPDAREKLVEKINRLKNNRDAMKAYNVMVRKVMKVEYATNEERIEALIDLIEKSEFKPKKHSVRDWAEKMLTPNCFNDRGFSSFELTNTGAEIRRLELRLEGLSKVESFESFEINDIKIDLVDGQIQVDFPWKPNEEIRSKLKRSPLALKWSSYSKKWVRKHTESTAGQYFNSELRKVLAEAKP